MAEIKEYKTLKECGLKFVSMLVSHKVYVLALFAIAFFMDLLPWYAWMPASLAILGIRGWEKLIIWGKRSEELTDVGVVEQPTTVE
jgi:hypothetical protein